MTKQTGGRWEKECESVFHAVVPLGIVGHLVRYKTFPSTSRVPKNHLCLRSTISPRAHSHKTAIKGTHVAHV